MKPIRYTEEMHLFIKNNYLGVKNKDLAQRFNEKFGTNISASGISSYKKRYGYLSGIDGKFKKGHKTHNKGIKQSEYMSPEAIKKTKATRFKKGNMPSSHRPKGSVRLNKDGYYEIKYAEPNKWKLMARFVWQEHNGAIPKSCVILHKNGDKTDDSIENLVLLKRSELVRLNYDGLMGDNTEINEVAINIARLKGKVSELNDRHS